MAGWVAIRAAWLLALAALVLSWGLVGRTLANPGAPAKPTGAVTGVVWGGLVFTDVGSLGRWLHARGAAYSVWSGKHPRAAATVEARRTHRARTRKHTTTSTSG
jgi:hypothetical protein